MSIDHIIQNLELLKTRLEKFKGTDFQDILERTYHIEHKRLIPYCMGSDKLLKEYGDWFKQYKGITPK